MAPLARPHPSMWESPEPMRTALSGGLRSVVAAGSALAVILMIALAATPGRPPSPRSRSPPPIRRSRSIRGARWTCRSWSSRRRRTGGPQRHRRPRRLEDLVPRRRLHRHLRQHQRQRRQPGPTDLKLRVEVPARAAAKDYKMTVHATSGRLTADLPITLTVAHHRGQRRQPDHRRAGQDRRPSARPPPSASRCTTTRPPSSSSRSRCPDAPAGWNITAKPSNDADPNNFTIAGGDTDTITVSADPPATVQAGDYQFTRGRRRRRHEHGPASSSASG